MSDIKASKYVFVDIQLMYVNKITFDIEISTASMLLVSTKTGNYVWILLLVVVVLVGKELLTIINYERILWIKVYTYYNWLDVTLMKLIEKCV